MDSSVVLALAALVAGKKEGVCRLSPLPPPPPPRDVPSILIPPDRRLQRGEA